MLSDVALGRSRGHEIDEHPYARVARPPATVSSSSRTAMPTIASSAALIAMALAARHHHGRTSAGRFSLVVRPYGIVVAAALIIFLV
jgi:hypothetical protein